MTVGIIGAMDVEIEHIAAQLENSRSETVSGITFISGKLGGVSVTAAVCGIGKVFAAVCAQTMIIRFHADAIINTGIAGSLSPQLGELDTVVAEDVVQHDMDTTFFGDEPGLISGINIVNIPCDRALSAAASAAAHEIGLECRTVRIASGDCFINAAAHRREIADKFGASVCEMEGAAIGQVCYINKTPFTVIRTVSDGADGSTTLDYNSFREVAAQRSAKIVTALIKHIGRECDE